MVAYSFKTRFADPILHGLGVPAGPRRIYPKRQTVRAIGKKRHARPGELVQLYTGLRTKQAKKLGEAVCMRTAPIKIAFPWVVGAFDVGIDVYIDGRLLTEVATRTFVQDDGFLSIDDFVMFWEHNHGIEKPFEGIIIYWSPK